MDQINTGVLKLKQYAAGSHVQGKKTDFSARREEPIFDALIGQKKEQCRSDVVDKGGKPETSKKDTAPEEKKEPAQSVEPAEKPIADKEEEACDVAREAAAAQIVWYVEPNAINLKVPEQMEQVAVIEKPLIFATNDEPTQPVDEIMAAKLAELTGGAEILSDGVQTQVAAEFGQTMTAAVVSEEEQAQVVPESEQTEVAEIVPESEQTDIVQETKIETGTVTNGVDVEIDTDGEENGEEAVAVETPLFDDVQAAPIKVAEAPARAESSESVEQQVAVKLSELIENGETKIQIQLEPVELGKLTIELTRSADGTLSVVLDAENAQTRNLLEKHVGTLQETLSDRSQRAVQITVEHNEESQRQDNQQREAFSDGRNGQHSQQQQQREDRHAGTDFLQQLRLGLIPLEDEEEE